MILERVAVAGKGKVFPESLVKVVGLKFKVEPDAKVNAPELVTPIVAELEKATVALEKLIVPELVKLLVPEVEEIVIVEFD